MLTRLSILLARRLPHRAARQLGLALGRFAGALPGSGRHRAIANLRAAFPELETRRLVDLATRAAAQRTAAIFDGASACRFDARALCRRLTLDGWNHLEATESAGRGVFILGAGWGSWQIAALAVALYRGPMETLGPWRGDPVFGRLAAAPERHAGQRLFGELDGAARVQGRLRAGDRIAFLADQPIGHGDTAPVPFLGRRLTVETLIAEASIEANAPVVPVFARPRAGGRWQLQVREPILPREETVESLTARTIEVVEREIRGRPELWPGWWQRDF